MSGGANRRRLWGTLLTVLLLGMLVTLVLWLARSPWFDLFRDRTQLQTLLAAQGGWAPLSLIALQIAQVIAAPIPGHLLAVAAGYLFGPWNGTLYTVVGVGVGSAIVLALARLGGRPLLAHWISAESLQRIDRWAARRGPFFFFLVFLLPFLPDDLACLGVGLSALPWLPMLALIILGRLPGHFLSAWIGAAADRVPIWVWAALAAGVIGLIAVYGFSRRRIEAWLLGKIEQRVASKP